MVTDVDLPVGRVVKAPGTVGPLMDYGVLTKVLIERGGVWTWIAPDHTWTDHGPRIRDAIAAAVDPLSTAGRSRSRPTCWD